MSLGCKNEKCLLWVTIGFCADNTRRHCDERILPESEQKASSPVDSIDWFDLLMEGLKKEEQAVFALSKANRINNQRANGHIDGIRGAQEVALRVKARIKSNTLNERRVEKGLKL